MGFSPLRFGNRLTFCGICPSNLGPIVCILIIWTIFHAPKIHSRNLLLWYCSSSCYPWHCICCLHRSYMILCIHLASTIVLPLARYDSNTMSMYIYNDFLIFMLLFGHLYWILQHATSDFLCSIQVIIWCRR